MSDQPSYYIIRRVDGGEMYGEFAFMRCEGIDDWTAAREHEHDDDTDYEILACYPRSRRRFYGSELCPDCVGEGTVNGLTDCPRCAGTGERTEYSASLPV